MFRYRKAVIKTSFGIYHFLLLCNCKRLKEHPVHLISLRMRDKFRFLRNYLFHFVSNFLFQPLLPPAPNFAGKNVKRKKFKLLFFPDFLIILTVSHDKKKWNCYLKTHGQGLERNNKKPKTKGCDLPNLEINWPFEIHDKVL